MANRDIVAIGTSAGGVEALRFLASRFKADFPASILVTIHLSRQFPSQLDAILGRSGPLPAHFAADGDRLERGHIYIAPPDRHLLIDGERMSLGIGPRENNARPAIDPMFRSVAVCCGYRTVGVVLTGALGDGASGLWALKQCGATAVVQDPDDASIPDMPTSALNRMQPDHVVRLAEVPGLLERLTRSPVDKPIPAPDSLKYEVEIARSGRASMRQMDQIGNRSVLACPDCGGVMWEIEDGDLVRYRCHVGHAYTAEHMSVALDESLRSALASAVRMLEERIALAQKFRKHAVEHGRTYLAERWEQQEQESSKELKVIHDSILRMDQIGTGAVPEDRAQQA